MDENRDSSTPRVFVMDESGPGAAELVYSDPLAESPIVLQPKTPIGPPIGTYAYEDVATGLDATILDELFGMDGPVFVTAEAGQTVSTRVLEDLASSIQGDVVLRVTES